MSPDTFKTLATFIGAVLTAAAVVAGAYFGLRSTKGSKAIDKQISDRSSAETERENQYNQMQEDLTGLRDENRSLRGDVTKLYEQIDILRAATEKRMVDAQIQHDRETARYKRHIEALVDHINQRKEPPAPSMSEVPA